MKKNLSKTKYYSCALLILFICALIKIEWMPSHAASVEIIPTPPPIEIPDPYADTQWAFLNNGSYQKLFGPAKIEMPSLSGVDLGLTRAFSIYNSTLYHTEEVICAVIDTGVDYNHPDLADAMWRNKAEIPGDGIDNDKNGYIDDIYGWNFYDNTPDVCHYREIPASDGSASLLEDCDDHGTHCAGIIAAKANNGVGIAGVASNINVKIMSLKIHGGPEGSGTVANAIRAIKYAEQMGAKVCNLSWGLSSENTALKEVMSHSSMLFVCAAGNNGTCNDILPVYPASFGLKNEISVTFFNPYGGLSSSANYGESSVDLAAPGIDILSTSVGSYQTLKGSSMATAYVSGLACMLYSFKPNLAPSNVKDVLLNSMTPAPLLNGYVHRPGIINAVKMIENCNLLVSDCTPPTIAVNSQFASDMIELTIKAADSDSGIRVVSYLPQKKKLSDFKKGTAGIVVTKPVISIVKAGTYTFYASDYSGNEMCMTYEVQDDITSPLITTSYETCVNDTELLIRVNASDEQSGLRQLKYIPGKKEISDFKSGDLGTVLTPINQTATLIVPREDCYTFYAVDHRGNKSVHLLEVTHIPVTDLKLKQSTMTLKKGSREKINFSYVPLNTTDRFYFTSLDPRIISVSQTGTIHAKNKGHTTVIIHSYSGLFKEIKVTVK